MHDTEQNETEAYRAFMNYDSRFDEDYFEDEVEDTSELYEEYAISKFLHEDDLESINKNLRSEDIYLLNRMREEYILNAIADGRIVSLMDQDEHYLTECLDRARSTVERMFVNISDCLKIALLLHLLNFYRLNPFASDEEGEMRCRKLDFLIKREEECLEDKTLPTIGLEIEVGYNFFPYEGNFAALLLKNLGLNVDEEVTSRRPTEFRFPPSASAWVQSRILLELKRAGAIPIDTSFASMHVNLGYISGEVDFNDDQTEEWFALVSALATTGYVSAKRFSTVLHGIFSSYRTNRWAISPVKLGQEVNNVTRMEYRTFRVNRHYTYRMLQELQQIGRLFMKNGDQALKDEFLLDIKEVLGSGCFLERWSNNQNDMVESNRINDEGVEELIRESERSKKIDPNVETAIDKARRVMTKWALIFAQKKAAN